VSLDDLAQVFIALFGIGALFMQYSDFPVLRKWAPWVGFAGQPAWIYSAYTGGKWGMLAVTVGYTIGWLRGGIRNMRISEK
jgi:hypothetical protein